MSETTGLAPAVIGHPSDDDDDEHTTRGEVCGL